ncbi:MAG TPA: hypothetical protein VGJ26_15970, partial [Pirellulales bacterium]
MSGLAEYAGADLVVKLRDRYENPSTTGFVLDSNDACTLVFQFAAFRPDGYAIFRTPDLVSAEPNENWTRMLHGEGFHGSTSLNPFVPIESIKKAIFTLYTCHQNVSLDCDGSEDAEESGYHIGRITSTHYRTLEFLFFDSNGNWFDTPYEIPYQSITRIQFRTPYIETFSKYLKKCPLDA